MKIVVDEKEVTMFFASNIWTYCPYCNKQIDGFCSNPANTTVVCDFCNKVFKIGTDIDIETY